MALFVPVKPTSMKYASRSVELPRVRVKYTSSCPFLPQAKPEPTSSEWTKFIHPNGKPYWYNSGRSTVLANHAYDLTNENQSRRLMEAIETLWNIVRPNTIPPVSATATTPGDQHVTADYELFIDIHHSEPNSEIRYYFVNWNCRSVFWVEPELFDAISEEHLVAQLHVQFWTHVADYPMHHPLPSRSREELCSIVGFNMIDSISFSGSMAPWTRQDMQLILSSLQQDRGRSMDPEPQYLVEETGISNAGIALLWREVCEARARTFYGDRRAKISRFERYSRDREPAHFAIARTVCSIIFFNRPLHFQVNLMDFFDDHDGTLYRNEWQAYVEREIEPEWQGTQAAIMLAANMAFLALDGVQKANDGPLLACKTLCLSSTTFSVAALFATLKLAHTHQRWRSATADQASEYMTYCSERMLGLFGLAMVYSIPFAMFMWSLFTFVAAVLLYAFQHWTLGAGLPLITATMVPIVVLLAWERWFFEGRPKREKWAAVLNTAVLPGP